MKKTVMIRTKLFASALLVLVMLISLSLPIFASTSPVVEIESVSAEPGNTVTVTVSLKNNTGITYLRVTPVVSSPAITLTAVENGSLFPTLDEGVNLVFSADNEIKTDGVLCTLRFAVAEDAELNSTAVITLTVRECYNDRYEDVNVAVTTGNVTVGCRHSETTDTVLRAPNCTESGEKLAVCNSCGQEMTVEIPATGHTEGEWETTKAPAVGVDGEMVIKCTVCNETVKSQTIPALSGDQGSTNPPATSTGCGGGSVIGAITVFFTSILPAAAIFIGKHLIF